MAHREGHTTMNGTRHKNIAYTKLLLGLLGNSNKWQQLEEKEDGQQ